MDELAAEVWRAAVAKTLKGADFDTLVTRTRDGITIEPLYLPAEDNRALLPGTSLLPLQEKVDLAEGESRMRGRPPLGDVEQPLIRRSAPPRIESGAGSFPVGEQGEAVGPWRDTRRPFGIIQRLDHPEGAAANGLALADAGNGATGLVLCGPGCASSRGFGIALADLPAALDGLWLNGLSLRLDFIPNDRPLVIDTLLALATRQGLGPDALDVDFGLDASGGGALASVTPLREWGLTGPVFRADGRPHHEAGASEAQELAAVLAQGVAALRALEPLGLDEARDALSFTLVADADQLLTTAKFRALRRLWTSVESACGLTPRPIRLHAETAWRMLARRDPHTNILRGTIAAAAAIGGGADSLTVLPFTSALGLPDAFARRLARNTALVLLEEAHLGRVADPAAGSGAYEAVTAALCAEAWRIFQGLEAAGGLAAACAAGTWQRDVSAMREKRRAAIAAGTLPLVGVTHFIKAAEDPPPVLARASHRATRDAEEAEAALKVPDAVPA